MVGILAFPPTKHLTEEADKPQEQGQEQLLSWAEPEQGLCWGAEGSKMSEMRLLMRSSQQVETEM